MSKKHLLFVDDERKILKGMRRMLYPLRDKWVMHFCESGSEACEVLDNKEIRVIVSDMRMPGMNGYELLKYVHDEYPQVVRIMLTGQPDKDVYREAMAISHYFLWKPVDFSALEAILGQAAELDNCLNNKKLVQLIGGIDSLPSLPTLFIELTRMLHKEDTSLAEIAALMEGDIAMVAQLLKLVNSSFFGLCRKIESLQEAVSYLGLEMIRSLVLVQHLFSQCHCSNGLQAQFDDLWQHSFQVATLSKKIAARIGGEPAFQEAAYLAGLLHDIGKLIILHHLPEEFEKIRLIAERESRSEIEVECELLGANHAAMGAYLTSLWGFPRIITEGVALHHSELAAVSTGTAPVFESVWHADHLCRNETSGSSEYIEMINI